MAFRRSVARIWKRHQSLYLDCDAATHACIFYFVSRKLVCLPRIHINAMSVAWARFRFYPTTRFIDFNCWYGHNPNKSAYGLLLYRWNSQKFVVRRICHPPSWKGTICEYDCHKYAAHKLPLIPQLLEISFAASLRYRRRVDHANTHCSGWQCSRPILKYSAAVSKMHTIYFEIGTHGQVKYRAEFICLAKRKMHSRA